MKPFPFIKIENKNYPTVIMGEDHFTGWFKKCKSYSSDKERAKEYKETLEMAYSKGVRGFSMSPHPLLIKVLKEFKKIHPEIVCIANHNWHNHYYFGKESLWEERNMKKLISNKFSKDEVKQFRLDEKEYNQQLKKFSFCDFALVGNLGHSSLIELQRTDIIEKEIELVRKHNLIPLLMCEGGSSFLKVAEKLNVAGSWLLINYYHPKPKLSNGLKPITAYRIFSHPEGFNFEKSISFIRKIKQIKSIVVGIANPQQAEETFSKLNTPQST